MIRTILCILMISFSASANNEVWAYLMKGEESFYPKKSSITDIAHFDLKVKKDGTLTESLTKPPALNNLDTSVRHHLVITAPYNADLFHHYLDKELPFRSNIIRSIVEKSRFFDGIQIDFEGIHSDDGTAFINFLIFLKSALPKDKILSVAVMARWESYMKKYPMDAYNYKLIGKIADRVIVMAYDEHYRTGKAGPIASEAWCSKIFNHALKSIPNKKIIMGIPLYGRAWQDDVKPKVSKQIDVNNELEKRNLMTKKNPETGGSFSYKETITVNVFHETLESIKNKQALYLAQPIQGLAYWRIGQEPDNFWKSN